MDIAANLIIIAVYGLLAFVVIGFCLRLFKTAGKVSHDIARRSK